MDVIEHQNDVLNVGFGAGSLGLIENEFEVVLVQIAVEQLDLIGVGVLYTVVKENDQFRVGELLAGKEVDVVLLGFVL